MIDLIFELMEYCFIPAISSALFIAYVIIEDIIKADKQNNI